MPLPKIFEDIHFTKTGVSLIYRICLNIAAKKNAIERTSECKALLALCCDMAETCRRSSSPDEKKWIALQLLVVHIEQTLFSEELEKPYAIGAPDVIEDDDMSSAFASIVEAMTVPERIRPLLVA